MEYNKDIQEREAFELAKYMAKHARTDIEECDIDALTIIHRAYNRFCSSNAINGDEVIYDTSYNEDMKQLLDQGFTIWDIPKVAYDEFPYIMIVRNPSNKEKQLKSIDGKTRNKYLDEFLFDLMNEIVHFPKDCPEYTAVYNKYVNRTNIYKAIYNEVDGNGGHLVFRNTHTLTIERLGTNDCGKKHYEYMEDEYVEDEADFKAIYIGQYDELYLIDTNFERWDVLEHIPNLSLKILLEIVLNCE